jgi:hypothetical protein
MTQPDFGSSFRTLLNEPLPPAPDPRQIAFELFRRDQARTRILAGLSICFWVIGTSGMFLLAYALNRLVIDVRVHYFLAAHPGLYNPSPGDIDVARATDLIHHSLPYVEASIVALMLAALFTVALIFSSRTATLNRINISLMQISGQLAGMRTESPAATGPSSAYYDAGYRLPPGRSFMSGPKIVLTLVLLLIGGAAILFAMRAAAVRRAESLAWQQYPQLSPFEAVQWNGHTPNVKVGGKWYELQAMNGLPANQVVQLCQVFGGGLWQKRFEEDLIEVLTRAGYPQGTTATLEVKDLETGKVEVLKDVPMTLENRQAIWEAATTRRSAE